MAILIFSSWAWAEEDGVLRYQIQPGDQLGKILNAMAVTPLWGKRGNVLRTVELNPEVILENGNLIRAGSWITLPQSAPARRPAALPEAVAVTPEDTELGTEVPAVRTEPKVEEIKPAAPVASEKQDGFFGFSPRFSFSRLDGTAIGNGSQASFLSGLNYGATLTWAQQWNESFGTQIGAGWLHVAIEPSTAATTSMENASQSFSDFSLSLEWRPWSSVVLSATGAASQQMFYHAGTDGSGVVFDRVVVPAAGLGLQAKVLSGNLFNLFLKAGYSSLMSAKTDGYIINAGRCFYGKIEVTQDSKAARWLYGIRFQTRQQSTSIVETRLSELGFDLGYQWRFGE